MRVSGLEEAGKKKKKEQKQYLTGKWTIWGYTVLGTHVQYTCPS